jgi:hypothetical protein
MTLHAFTGAEAPTGYPADLHPAYWRFPEGNELYTGLIEDIHEEKPFPGKPGSTLVIEVVNGPYGGRINLNTQTTPQAELRRVMEALGALEHGKLAPDRLLEARGMAIAFTHREFLDREGRWRPVLRFAAVIPQILPLSPARKFGWSHPEVQLQTSSPFG